MSHEFRTPLNHIMGFTELILGKSFGGLTETQEEYLTDIYNSSEHLLSLVNQVLDVSKIEAGKLDLHKSQINLKKILEQCLSFMDKAVARNIRLTTDIDQIPETIYCRRAQSKADPIQSSVQCSEVYRRRWKHLPGGPHDRRAGTCNLSRDRIAPDVKWRSASLIQASGFGKRTWRRFSILFPSWKVHQAESIREPDWVSALLAAWLKCTVAGFGWTATAREKDHHSGLPCRLSDNSFSELYVDRFGEQRG